MTQSTTRTIATAQRGRGRIALVGAVALAVVAAAAFWMATKAGDGSASDRSSAAVNLEHVHGLGVDPGDGALYAGSHYGLYRLPDGDSQIDGPVAGRVQDFMGFTVAGPDHFLASGHPGEGQGGPSSLGLIESTDGGRTWENRSLAGKADFHSLEFRHDTVYGLNAMTGEFMVSSDMTAWETRSRLPMADFAVSPDDADTIVATTQQGPALSTDGGKTFGPIGGAPLLVLVSWADDGTLVGVDPDGAVYTRARNADEFVPTGQLSGSPEALHAEDASTIYAAAAGMVWRSTDGGKTFRTHPGE